MVTKNVRDDAIFPLIQLLFSDFRPGLTLLSQEELGLWLLGQLASRGKGFSYPEQSVCRLPNHTSLSPHQAFIKAILFQEQKSVL